MKVLRVSLRVAIGLITVLSVSCASDETKSPADAVDNRVVPVDPSHFIPEALVGKIVKEQRALADGTTAWCYVIRTYSEPLEHAMGPWSPKTITDGKEAGGIWIHDGQGL